MDSVFRTLSNPWVLGIGAAIGAVMLLSRSGSGGGAPTGGGYYSEAFLTDVGRTNAALMQTAIQTNATIEGRRIESETTLGVATLTTLAKLADIGSVERSKLAETRAGVVRTAAATQAAIVIDQQQNFARLGMTWINADLQKRLSADRVKVASIQAKAAESAAIWNAIPQLAGSAVKAAALL